MSDNHIRVPKRTVLSLPTNVTHNSTKPTIKLEMQFTNQLTPVHYKKKRLAVNDTNPAPAAKEVESNSDEPYVWVIPQNPKPKKNTLLVATSKDDIEIIKLLESRNIKARFADGLSFRYFGICVTGTNAVKASVPVRNSKNYKAKLFSFSKFDNPLTEALTWQLKEGKAQWAKLWAGVCHGHLSAIRKDNLGINVRPTTQGKNNEFVHCVVEWRELEDKKKKGSAWFSATQSGTALNAEKKAFNKQKELIKKRKAYLEGLGSTVSIFAM